MENLSALPRSRERPDETPVITRWMNNQRPISYLAPKMWRQVTGRWWIHDYRQSYRVFCTSPRRGSGSTCIYRVTAASERVPNRFSTRTCARNWSPLTCRVAKIASSPISQNLLRGIRARASGVLTQPTLSLTRTARFRVEMGPTWSVTIMSSNIFFYYSTGDVTKFLSFI